VHLPPGATIDVSDVDSWRFPVGTKLWKEFAFGGRRIETRFLWRASEDRWVFAAYVWNETQTDALLVPFEGLRNVVQVAPGKRHSIPGTTDCLACHDAGRGPVLGFGALQLSDDRDRLAPHAEPLRSTDVTLKTLVDEGRLAPPRPDLAISPPRIAASTPEERAVLGYLSANCGTCHNAAGPLGGLEMVLSHSIEGVGGEAPPGLATLVGRPSRWTIRGSGAGESRRVVPGAPRESSLLVRMASRSPSSQMPPLGTVLPDLEAIRLVERWIADDLARAPQRTVQSR
jgi:hypothetical protein